MIMAFHLVPELDEGHEVHAILAVSSLREVGSEGRWLHLIPFGRLRDYIGIFNSMHFGRRRDHVGSNASGNSDKLRDHGQSLSLVENVEVLPERQSVPNL